MRPLGRPAPTGIHYANGSLLNGPIDPTHPHALIYEPQSNGELKLVGVEFIILASALPPTAAPQVDGHLMLYVDTPNRYGLPAFFELHVWAWRDKTCAKNSESGRSYGRNAGA